MSKKITDPNEAIAAIQEARDMLWNLYHDKENQYGDNGELVNPTVKLDALLEAEQDKWRKKSVPKEQQGEDK